MKNKLIFTIGIVVFFVLVIAIMIKLNKNSINKIIAKKNIENLFVKNRDYSRVIEMLLFSKSLSKKDRDEFTYKLAVAMPRLSNRRLNTIFNSVIRKHPGQSSLINSGWAWVLMQKGECEDALKKISKVENPQDPFVMRIKKEISLRCNK